MPRLLLVLAASFVLAQGAFAQDDPERRFVVPSKDLNRNKQTRAEILKAVCEGDVEGDSCSKCPGSDQGPWSISGLVVGHFSSPRSEEAFAGVGSCYYSGHASPLGLLLGKRNGEWTMLQEIVAFEPDSCMRRKFRSGREFLICEFYEYSQDGERSYSLSTLMVENDQSKFHNLFTATDTSRVCMEGKAERAVVENIEFRDLNGNGLEDISIAAAYGWFQMTGRRLEQCGAAEEDRIQSDVRKPTVLFPLPPVMKKYKIDLLFDGNRYTPTPESGAAVALFHRAR